MKSFSRIGITVVALVTLSVAYPVFAQFSTNSGTTPHSTTTNDNVGILASGNVAAVPFIVANNGNSLVGGTAFYNARFGDATATHGFLIGYDATQSTGVLSAVGGDGIAIWTFGGATFNERLRVTASGNVGIGTTSPSAMLDVAGNVNVTGNIAAKYQDVAEWVPANEPLKPGTVVVLNPAKTNEVMASSHAYDTAVAGVVSAKPGLILGEKSANKEQIATTGRVKVHVDASKGKISIGDLLVTSDKAGVAMKSEPVDLGGIKLHRPGTIVGKALESLDKGEGDILVLLSLQ